MKSASKSAVQHAGQAAGFFECNKTGELRFEVCFLEGVKARKQGGAVVEGWLCLCSDKSVCRLGCSAEGIDEVGRGAGEVVEGHAQVGEAVKAHVLGAICADGV